MTPGTQALDHLMDILLVWKMNPAQRKTSERAEELGRCVDNLCGAGVAGNRGRRISRGPLTLPACKGVCKGGDGGLWP
jgi:hypothetical protein